MSLGLAIGVLAIVVIVMLCAPLLRPRSWDGKRPEYELGVYKDQLKELERDHERGLLNDEQAKQAKAEIERRLLAADTRRREGYGFHGSRKATAILMLAAPLIPAGAVAIYLVLGQPDMPDMPFAQRIDVSPENGAMAAAGMARAVDDMRARVEANPEDTEAWLMLGDSLLRLEQFAEARDALTRAYQLTDDPYIRAEAAEAAVAAADSTVSPDALAAFEALHEIDPFEPKSRFYIGLAADQAGDPARALQEWIDLIVLSPRDAPWLPGIQGQIARVGQESGADLSTLRPSEEALALVETARGNAMPQPSQEDIQRVQEMTPEEQQAFIQSMVDRLAQRLEDNPDDPDGWMRLSRAYQMLGEAEKAEEARRRALESAGQSDSGQ